MTEHVQKRRDFRSESSYGFLYRKLQDGEVIGDSDWQKTATINLSAGGAAIFVEGISLAPGDIIEFQLLIPGGPVFGIAEVVRHLETQDALCAVGVRFVSVAPGDRDKIAKIVLADGLENRHGTRKTDGTE